MTEGQDLQVLVVCAANQCRSRALEALLRHALRDDSDVHVSSAGTRVLAPSPPCLEASDFVRKLGIDPEADRPSVELTPKNLVEAHLILAADSQVRSDIVAIDPTSRPRTFTLLQAAAAATYINSQDLIRRARDAYAAGLIHVTEPDGDEEIVVATALPTSPAATREWLVQELAAAQAVALLTDGLDVPDAHTERGVQHRHTLNLVKKSFDPIAELLRRLGQSE